MGPVATVAAILERRRQDTNEILLTKRSNAPYTGYWCLPGGHIDEYESAYDAVVREVKEETGYEYSPRFVRYQDEIIPDDEIHHLVLIFRGTVTGSPQAQPEEVEEMRWVTPANALSLPIAFLHREVIEELG